jgi:hypothetical protein
MNTRNRQFSDGDVMRSYVMHEVQHGLQGTEGFQRGGSPREFTPDQIAAERARLMAIAEPPSESPSGWGSVSNISGDMPDLDVGRSLYNRLAGEVEARAVQKRMDLTPDQRRSRPPWMDYDVPEDQQIVRGVDGKEMMSIRTAMKEQIKTGVELPDGTRINGVMLFAIRAFHGSPHDFDRFSLDKIGTGEGAQFYGRGLYFAESEVVARTYKATLSGTERSERIRLHDPHDAALYYMERARWDKDRALADIDAILERGKLERGDGDPDLSLMEIRRIVSDETASIPRSTGRLYEVSLDVDESELLDWDAPMSAQSDVVKAALRAEGLWVEPIDPVKAEAAFAEARRAAQENMNDATWKAVQDAQDRADTARRPSSLGFLLRNVKDELIDRMQKHGVRGIRYLDQDSRSANAGSRNIVVFDDSLVEIVAKDGQPVNQPKFSIRQDAEPEPSPKAQIKGTVRTVLETYADLKRQADALGVSPDDLAELVQRSPETAPIAQRLETARAQLADAIGDEQARALTDAVIAASPMLPDLDAGRIASVVDTVLDEMFPDAPPPRPANDNLPTPLQRDMLEVQRLQDMSELVSVCRAF